MEVIIIIAVLIGLGLLGVIGGLMEWAINTFPALAKLNEALDFQFEDEL
jgi:hypothetical protein